MPWAKGKTVRVFVTVVISSLIFMVTDIGIALYVLYQNSNAEYSRSLIYILATTYGNGLGCIWLRINRAKSTWSHGMIHTVVLALMLIGHRDIFKLLMDGDIADCYRKYALSMFTISIYIIQYILSFHLMVFRGGRSLPEKAFRSGLHAFFGALLLFICIVDGVLVEHKMMKDLKVDAMPPLLLHLSITSMLFFGVCTWYIILNPNFDWRRLKALSLTKVSQTSLNRTPSKTLMRTPSKTSVRSASRPVNRSSNRPPRRSSSQPITKRFD